MKSSQFHALAVFLGMPETTKQTPVPDGTKLGKGLVRSCTYMRALHNHKPMVNPGSNFQGAASRR